MIAYNKDWLHNLYVRELADEALYGQAISTESHQAIYAATPAPFYTPNIYTRVGMAVATLFIVGATCGFFALFFLSTLNMSDAFEYVYPLFLIAGGITSYFIAISYIRNRKYFNSGADNMLIWLSGTLLFLGLVNINHVHLPAAGYGLIGLVIATVLAIRFADTLSTVVAFFSLLYFLFHTLSHAGSWGMQALPFVLMLVAGITCYMATNVEKQYPLYRNCTYFLRLAALVALYAAGNYYIVREFSADIAASANSDVYTYASFTLPMGWLFWIFTFAIPPIYIALGIRNRQLMFIRTGLLLLAAAVFTFRAYYSVLPAEVALTIGGSAVIIASYLLINYLKTPRNRFTFLPGYSGHEKTAIEQLLDTQLAGKHNNDTPSANTGGW